MASRTKGVKITIRFLPFDDESREEVSQSGHKPLHELKLSTTKTWDSVSEHLEKKWSCVEKLKARIRIFYRSQSGQPSLNMCAPAQLSNRIGDTIAAHPSWKASSSSSSSSSSSAAESGEGTILDFHYSLRPMAAVEALTSTKTASSSSSSSSSAAAKSKSKPQTKAKPKAKAKSEPTPASALTSSSYLHLHTEQLEDSLAPLWKLAEQVLPGDVAPAYMPPPSAGMSTRRRGGSIADAAPPTPSVPEYSLVLAPALPRSEREPVAAPSQASTTPATSAETGVSLFDLVQESGVGAKRKVSPATVAAKENGGAGIVVEAPPSKIAKPSPVARAPLSSQPDFSTVKENMRRSKKHLRRITPSFLGKTVQEAVNNLVSKTF
jgi:hypothetical protein